MRGAEVPSPPAFAKPVHAARFARAAWLLVGLVFFREMGSDMGSSTTVVSRAVSADGGDEHGVRWVGGPVSVCSGSCDACGGGVVLEL